MSEPTVSSLTRRIYDGLPDVYRDSDAGLDYPLLRYLAGIGDQLDAATVLHDRLTYTPTDDENAEATTTADLVDPTTANARWLPWLAQLVGVTVAGRTVAEQRAAIASPETTWDHGTPAAITDAAVVGLSGTQTVTVSRHHDGNPFVIGIGTRDSETLDLSTWGALKAYAPTWADLHRLRSFALAVAPLVLAAAEAERPAGYRLVRYSTGP